MMPGAVPRGWPSTSVTWVPSGARLISTATLSGGLAAGVGGGGFEHAARRRQAARALIVPHDTRPPAECMAGARSAGRWPWRGRPGRLGFGQWPHPHLSAMSEHDSEKRSLELAEASRE